MIFLRWSKMNTDWNRMCTYWFRIYLSSFSICFRHKRQSWWSSLHAQVGICPIGEADFCTTKRRHLPLHGQKLSGDQRSKGVYHPCELPSDIFHSSWFFFALGTTVYYFELGFPPAQCMLRRVCVKKHKK